MPKLVGIQLKNGGRVHDFDPGHFVLKKGDKVMVITEDGPAVGCVCHESQYKAQIPFPQPLKKIFRMATKEEIETYEHNCHLEETWYKISYKKIKERSLPMSLVSLERRFDGSKMVLYFTAEGRVDFRELVKDLVREFRTRIELRQIGVRNQAKMVGGLGTCGRVLCCTSFLNSFSPATIKMAKDQNISLNPNKISGMCGRLMCCLTYEHKEYVKIKKRLPRIGRRIVISEGKGKVIRQDVLKERLTVLLESGTEIEIGIKDVIEQIPSKQQPKKKKRK